MANWHGLGSKTMDDSRIRQGHRAKPCALRAGTGLCALSAALLTAPVFAQDNARNGVQGSGQDTPPELAVPAPPPNADLPVIEPIISDEEFAEDIPDLAAEDDIELDRPLESIAEFEARMEREQALADAGEDARPDATG